MTQSMVEIVAKAIESELDKQEMVVAHPFVLRKMKAQRIARAAIEAMREPNDAMFVAAHEELVPALDFLAAWHAGIDAALNEEGGNE